jgi:hypothetical protein
MNWFGKNKELSMSESEQTDEEKRSECFNEIKSDPNAPLSLKKFTYFKDNQNWITYMNYFNGKNRQDCWNAFNDVEEDSENSVSQSFRRPTKTTAKKLVKKSSRRYSRKSPGSYNSKSRQYSTKKSKTKQALKSPSKSKRRVTRKSPIRSKRRSTRKR